MARVHDDAGIEIDATFFVERIGSGNSVVFESKGGTPDHNARNLDYNAGLALILARLAALRATILRVAIETRRTEHLPLEDRTLALEIAYPIPLVAVSDLADLRRQLGRAQAQVGRQPDASGGGNPTKRIRIFVDGNDLPDVLEARLARPSHQSAAIQGEREGVEAAIRPRRVRGQGRGLSGPERRAVEERAMQVAIAFFQPLWPQVSDVSATEPFDLHCWNGERELRVEVKGTIGDGSSVLLTPGEVRHAREHAGRVAIFVVAHIELERGEAPVARGGTHRLINPWNVDAGELIPIGFECRLEPAE